MAGSSFSIKAGAVFLIFDDFTGNPVSLAGLKMTAPKGVKLIKKEAGCLAVVQCPAEPFKIRLESPYYLTKEITVDPAENANDCPILKIWLLPGECYEPGAGVTCVYGKAAPGSSVFLTEAEPVVKLRLLADYKGGAEISLYHPLHLNLEGKLLKLEKKNQTEQVCLKEKTGGIGTYLLEKPLKNSYEIVGSSVKAVSRSMADQQGYYRIFLNDIPGTGSTVELVMETSEEKRKKRFASNADAETGWIFYKEAAGWDFVCAAELQ